MSRHFLFQSLLLRATGYESRNIEEFVPIAIENTLLYSGIPVDPCKLNMKSSFGGGFIQVSCSAFVYSICCVIHCMNRQDIL